MKPIALNGHERAITRIRYNPEGDLLFSCAKDIHPTVWFSLNGERLGTYDGHTGAVWCLDVNWSTTKVLTGAGDNSSRLWDCETGKCINIFHTQSAVRTCGFTYSGNTLFFSTDKAMGHMCQIFMYDVRDHQQMKDNEPYMKIPVSMPKVTSAIASRLDKYILTGHDDGTLIKWEMETGEKIHSVQEHSRLINDIQPSKNGMMVITASKDNTAKLFDADTLELLKIYKTERPVNSASISPNKDHVVLGGGQEAMDVTTTSSRIGKFDARFFHLIFEEEFGRVKGHFGPINSLAFSPDGMGYSSGGEDGYVRIHTFDPQFHDFEFEY
ncbi:eukaryotic translation initiation factor 3 subunit I-like [Acanthaster planci]|uniref:Eukaryotic translation initiation factor 3 subunit I n=1 Tax=Acanthaster planci TaxID=133434 RepID=A0A8B7Y8W3_ACAPL|nr:eukaryotic translation initiation factor 3 subunit I-like [Acanthaster planci]